MFSEFSSKRSPLYQGSISLDVFNSCMTIRTMVDVTVWIYAVAMTDKLHRSTQWQLVLRFVESKSTRKKSRKMIRKRIHRTTHMMIHTILQQLELNILGQF